MNGLTLTPALKKQTPSWPGPAIHDFLFSTCPIVEAGHDEEFSNGLTPTPVLAKTNSVMAGLGPAIHDWQTHCMRGGWVYIVTNRRNGILYTGVARDLARRIWQHREGLGGVFTRRYGLKRLVWCEYHDTIMGAIQREKTLKHWPRAWKVRLIHAANPDWNDLYETINQ